MKHELIEKINNRAITVGIIGLGYVGLPLAIEIAKSGFNTIGFDISTERVRNVNEGASYIDDVKSGTLMPLTLQGRLSATTDFSRLSDVDFIAVCVPTPLDKNQMPDISYVKSSAETISRYLHRGNIVVLESTTYPSTTEDLILPILEKNSGLKCGSDFFLGYSPERVDPGNTVYNTGNTPKIVGAVGSDALELISEMYSAFITAGVYKVGSAATAEMTKILENTYRHINIGLINEMTIICNRMGINIWEVIDAAKTKPYGFQAFYPGPGLGGHCIPLDPHFFSWKAREYGYHTSMIEASSVINDRMPDYVVDRASRILNKHRKPLNGSKALILGIAYKQDIADYRESPALKVMSAFVSNGTLVSYYDPFIREYTSNGSIKRSIPAISSGVLLDFDIIVITTAHTDVDYETVASAGIPVLDCKNACKRVKNRENIELI